MKKMSKWIGAAAVAALFATLVAIGCSDRDNPAANRVETDGGSGTAAGSGSGSGNDGKNAANGDIMAQNPAIPVVTEDASDKYTVSAGGTYTDKNGHTYNTIRIQGKAAGLGKKAWDGDTTNPDIWGMVWYAENAWKGDDTLFTWDTAVTLCDKSMGWHLPTREQWNKLITAAKGATVAGAELKANTGWASSKPGAKDSTGKFNAKGTGYIDTKDPNKIKSKDSSGLWWSIDTGSIRGTAYYRGMSWNNDKVIENTYGKNFKFAVRCVAGDVVEEEIAPISPEDSVGIIVKQPVGYGKSEIDTSEINKNAKCRDEFVTGKDSTVCQFGTMVTLVAKPETDKGLKLKRWIAISGTDSLTIGTGDRRAILLKRDTTITAEFDTITYTLSITMKEGGDTIFVDSTASKTHQDTVSDAKEKKVLCFSSKALTSPNDRVLVKAKPKPGYRFLGWQGETTTGSDTISLYMDKNKTLIANFQKICSLTVKFADITIADTVRVGAKKLGSAVFADTNIFVIDYGTKITLTALPLPLSGKTDSSRVFKNWSGGTTGKTNPLTLTMSKNLEVTAVFENIYDTSKTGSTLVVGATFEDELENWSPENMSGGDGTCYGGNDKTENCTKYGKLYTWGEAMSVCEDAGMYLPTRKDWEALIKATGVTAAASGTVLKDSTAGFYAKLGGYGEETAVSGEYKWQSIGESGLYWTADTGTGANRNAAYYYGLNSKTGAIVTNIYSKKYLFSARCVQEHRK